MSRSLILRPLVLLALFFGVGTPGTGLSNSGEGLARFTQFVPLQYPIRKVRIPRFDESGKQVAFIQAAVMTKLHDDLFSLEGLEVWLFNENEERETTITNPMAYFCLSKHLLFSEAETVFVNERGLRTRGQGFVFDTERHIASLTGRTETIISNSFLDSNANRNP